ncbi:MAG: GGDEF domain-containing protein [Anaerolineales bacterium]
MNEFEALVAKHGIPAMLEHIHALVVLVQKDGTLLSWNRAFETYKSKLPANIKFEDLFLEKENIQAKLILKQTDHWIANLCPLAHEADLICDCMILPLEEDRLLFIAEHVNTDPTTAAQVQRLGKRAEMFKLESEAAKKLAKRKQVEVDGIMAQAHEIAQIDVLTLLPNRRMVVRELQDEVLRAQRYNTPLTISVVDVDKFKKINDSYGHLSGDEVLKQIGQQLNNQIRHPDLAGRYGGEEFLILLPNSNANAAAEQAARLCKNAREMVIQFRQHVLQVTISVGIAEFKHNVDTWETLLNRADTAMYQAKSSGRDRWVIAE